MATSQQQWRKRSLVLLLAAAVALFLLVGVCDAKGCPPNKADCNHNGICETWIKTDKHNCGYCGHQCSVTWGPHAYAYCSGGSCYQKCNPTYYYKSGWCYKRT